MEEIDFIEQSFNECSCPYCPHYIESLKLPKNKAKKLADDTIPPTHIEIECPKCENVFYHTQENYYFSFSDRGWGPLKHNPESRKTSPGKNIYVPKEEVEVE